jgi:hypothetical protein
MSDDTDLLELEAASADLSGIEDPDMREAMRDLIRQGLVVDSGRRCDGKVVWVAVDHVRRQ